MTDDLQKEELELFVGLIMDKCGMRLTRNRLIRMKKVIVERMTEIGVNDITEYYRSVTSGEKSGEELSRLCSSIMTGEHRFFTNEDILSKTAEYIADKVTSAKTRNGKPLARVWFPYCSWGEDPYSFSMLLTQKLEPGMMKSVEILATGTNRYDVEKACTAMYPSSSLTELGRDRITRYFKSEEAGKKVTKNIRNMVTFGLIDLVNGIFPSMLNGTSGLHLIVLRNVLTFYNWKIAERIISKFHECLYEDGLLLLGVGERLPNMAGWEGVEGTEGRMYRRKNTASIPGVSPGLEVLKTSGHVAPGVSSTMRSPKGRNLYVERAQDYLSTGQTRKALITLTEAVSSGVDDARIYLRLADLYASRNDIEVAEKKCYKAIDIDATCAEAHVLLGVIKLRKGHYKESMDNLRKALFIDPNNHEVKLHIARVLDRMGKRTAAREVYTRIVNEGGDSSSPLIMDVAKKALEEVSVN